MLHGIEANGEPNCKVGHLEWGSMAQAEDHVASHVLWYKNHSRWLPSESAGLD